MYASGYEDAEEGGIRRRDGGSDQAPRQNHTPSPSSLDRYTIKDPIPHDHRKLKLELHTAGAYGVASRPSCLLPSDFDTGNYSATQHHLFSAGGTHLAWTTWLSGRGGYAAKLFIVVTTVCCHLVMVHLSTNARFANLCNIGPPVLAIISAKCFFFLTSQEARRLATGVFDSRPHQKSKLLPWSLTLKSIIVALSNIHPGLDKRVQLRVVLKTVANQFWRLSKRALLQLPQWRIFVSTRTETILVLMLFAPLVSIPIRPTVQYVQRESGPYDYHNACYDLDELADYIGTSLPHEQHYMSDRWTPNGESAGWPHSFAPLLPNWDLDDSFDARYAAFTPFFLTSTLPDKPLSVFFEVISHYVIVVSVKCQKATVRHTTLDNSFAVGRTLKLQVVDSDGCGATVATNLEHLSDGMKTDLLRVLMEFSRRINESAPNIVEHSYHLAKTKLFSPQLIQYIQSANESASLSILHPQWLAGNVQRIDANASVCQTKSILIASKSPTLFTNQTIQDADINAASCTTMFDLFTPQVDYRRDYFDDSFLYRKQKFHQVRFSHSESRKDYWRDRYLISPHRHSQHYSRYANSVLRRQLSRMQIFDRWTLFGLVENEYLAILESDPRGRALIKYGSDRLAWKIIQDLSFASETIAPNCRLHRQKPQRVQYSSSRLEDCTLQNQLWFRRLFWLSINWLIFIIIFQGVQSPNHPSGVPWETCSIAAKVALMRYSRLTRCFLKGRCLPEDLHLLNPIRIGYWSCSQNSRAHLWHADSLLNACAIPPLKDKSPPKARHSFRSLPVFVRPHTVLLMAVVFLATMLNTGIAMTRINHPGGSPEQGAPLTQIMSRSNLETPLAFAELFSIRLLPNIVSVALTVYWWDALIVFYKERLPWAELHHPSISDKTLTLDYRTTPLPVKKALHNKHWMLSLLLVGSFIILPLPILTSQLSNMNMNWLPQESNIIMAERNWTWHGTSTRTVNLTTMRRVLQDAFVVWNNRTAMPPWTSYREALVPTTMSVSSFGRKNRLLPHGRAGFWMVDTESISARLECFPLHHIQVKNLGFDPSQTLETPLELSVSLNGTGLSHQGSSSFNVFPCFSKQTYTDGTPVEFCSHWELKVFGEQNQSDSRPAWIISSAHFGPRLVTMNTLLCKPQISSAHGKAKLLSLIDDVSQAMVQDYSADTRHTLPDGLAHTFSMTLNRSVFSPIDRSSQWSSEMGDPGLRFDSPLISLPRFRGDVLSLLSYQDMLRNGISFDDSNEIAEVSSLVFSTIFAIFAQSTDVLKIQTPSRSVPVVALRWHQAFTFNPAVIASWSVIAGFLLIVMASHIVTMILGREYRFPISPEPFHNACFFLYHSGLIQIFERQIEDPQKLTLQEFYSKVQQLGHRYVFKLREGCDDWMDAVVDIATTSEEATDDTTSSEPMRSRSGYAQVDGEDEEEAEQSTTTTTGTKC